MIEGGIIDSELRKIGTKYNEDFRQETQARLPKFNIKSYTYWSFSGIDDALSLGYHNVAFAFAILAFGLITAILLIVIEVILRGLKIRLSNSDADNPGFQPAWTTAVQHQ